MCTFEIVSITICFTSTDYISVHVKSSIFTLMIWCALSSPINRSISDVHFGNAVTFVALLPALPFLRRNTECSFAVVISVAHVRRADMKHTKQLAVPFTGFTGSKETLFRSGLRERRVPALPDRQEVTAGASQLFLGECVTVYRERLTVFVTMVH